MDSRNWYWQRNGKKVGPLSANRLRQLADRGDLQPEDMLQQEGSRQPVRAGSIEGLFKPPVPARRPLWPWIAACAGVALLGGGIALLVMNLGKDETPQVAGIKPGDSDSKPGDKEKKQDEKEKKPDDEKKPEEKKPEEKKPDDREKKPDEKDRKPDDKEKKPDDKPAADAAEKLRAEEFTRFMKAGKVFQEAKQYDAAIEVYTSAIKLNPDSQEALDGLKAAKDARAADMAQDQAKRDAEQKQRAFRLLMDNGQANLKRKQFDLAILAFTEAIKLKPDDEDAKAALLAAEKAQKAAAVAVNPPAVPPVRPAQNPNLIAYKQRMAEGRTALFVTGDVDAAVIAFTEALRLYPDDLVAAAFLAEAQKTRNAVATVQVAQAQLIQRELWRGVDLRAALAQGRTALANGNLDLAGQAFAYAYQLAPNDPAVIQARLDLQTAQNQVLAQEGYQQFLRNGRQALRDKRYNDAVNAYTQAVNLAPFDQATRDLLREAIRLRNEARAAANVAQQTGAQVRQLLTDGRAALARNDLEAASASFTAAQQLAPTDPGVIKALQDLAAARNTAQAAGDRQKLLNSFRQLMKAGQDAQNAKRFQEAARLFGDAARQVRGTPDLVTQLQEAERARVDAEKALKAQNQDDTKRANRVRDLLRTGHNALANFQFDSAAKAFADAKALAANDPDVHKAQQELDQARTQAQKFELRVDPAQVKLIAGMRGQVKVTVDRKGRDGYQGPIELELRGLPLGVTATHEVIPAGQNTVLVPLSAFPNTAAGVKNDVFAEGKVRGIAGSVKSPFFTIVSAKK